MVCILKETHMGFFFYFLKLDINIKYLIKKEVYMKILLVEDSDIQRMVTKNILSNFKEINKIDLAKNGLEASNLAIRAYIEKDPYDVILLDVIMPISSGFHALENIRKYERKNLDIKKKSIIIVVTSLDGYNEKNKAIEFGVDEVIMKPITIELLKNTFKKLKLIEED